MRKMLKLLKTRIIANIKALEGRYFVDSAPVLERAWAAKSGLGWIGKNANLISPKHGSFVFIGELITDIELIYDKPIPDYCGGCSKCIQACPTKAIVADRVIDSRKCISYWTIENKEKIDPSLRGNFNNWIFGCDICQDVCPWNKKTGPHSIKDLRPKPDLFAMTRYNWKEITEESYNHLFTGSAVMRTGYEGLRRNIRFAEE
jgi:epoxyqueuosine reductase